MYASDENDELYGEGGNDTLWGGGNDDTLWGGGNDDTLVGGVGDDELRGRTGNNSFEFNLGDGKDAIVYDTEGATIDAIAFGAGVTADSLRFERTNNDLIIHYGASEQINVRSYFSSGSYNIPSRLN